MEKDKSMTQSERNAHWRRVGEDMAFKRVLELLDANPNAYASDMAGIIRSWSRPRTIKP